MVSIVHASLYIPKQKFFCFDFELCRCVESKYIHDEGCEDSHMSVVS